MTSLRYLTQFFGFRCTFFLYVFQPFIDSFQKNQEHEIALLFLTSQLPPKCSSFTETIYDHSRIPSSSSFSMRQSKIVLRKSHEKGEGFLGLFERYYKTPVRKFRGLLFTLGRSKTRIADLIKKGNYCLCLVQNSRHSYSNQRSELIRFEFCPCLFTFL